MHSAMRSLSNNLYYFSPECARLICEHWRKNSVNSLIKGWNQEHGLKKGIYLQWNADYVSYMAMAQNGIIYLRTDKIDSNGIM